MNVLKGKSEKEILNDFENKYDINEHDWFNMIKYIKRPKFGKHFVLVWGLTSILIGLCFVISTIVTCNDNQQFPFIFSQINIGFIERFVNYLQVGFMIGIGCFLVIFPFFKFAKVYNWEH